MLRTKLGVLAILLFEVSFLPTACVGQEIHGDLKLQRQLDDVELKGTWYYDDLDGAVAAAKDEGKPLLIVFRCVP